MGACKENLIKLCTNYRCKTDRYSGHISGKRSSGPIESSGCTQVKLEPGHKARLAMFSARFNEKNKEACIAVAAWIQALKLFGTHIQVKWCKNHQESFRRIMLLTKLQDGTAVGSWGHGNEVPRRAQASNGESLRNINGGSRRGKDMFTYVYCTHQNSHWCTEATTEPLVGICIFLRIEYRLSIESCLCAAFLLFVMSLRCLCMFVPCFARVL